MAMNLIVYPVGLIGFWLTGYGFMMGGIRQWPSHGAFALPHRELSVRFDHHLLGLIGLGNSAYSRSITILRALRCSCSRRYSWGCSDHSYRGNG
jgi:hypothetical protein